MKRKTFRFITQSHFLPENTGDRPTDHKLWSPPGRSGSIYSRPHRTTKWRKPAPSPPPGAGARTLLLTPGRTPGPPEPSQNHAGGCSTRECQPRPTRLKATGTERTRGGTGDLTHWGGGLTHDSAGSPPGRPRALLRHPLGASVEGAGPARQGGTDTRV